MFAGVELRNKQSVDVCRLLVCVFNAMAASLDLHLLTEELINHNLSCVCEVTKLRFPNDLTLKISEV